MPTTRETRDERDSDLEALRQEVALLRARMDGSAQGVQQALAAKAPPLEPVENERDRILNAWATERAAGQVEAIFIPPDDNDKRAAEALGAKGLDPVFPPQIFQVNGVQVAVPKGESTTVPASIAAIYRYMTNPWKARGVIKPLTFDQNEARLGLG